MILTGSRTLELQEFDLPLEEDRIVVDVAAWGICNSEIGDWKGLAASYPRTIGHEWAGTAVHVGAATTGIREGDLVTGLGGVGLADFISVKDSDCYRLSPRIDPIHAMCEPLKCVVTVVRAAAPEAGDVAVVVGCGPMGLWCIQLLAGNLLSALIAVDPDTRRLELARRYGATHALDPRSTDVEAEVRRISAGHMADFVIEGTGRTDVLGQSLTFLKKSRGRLTLMSMYKEPGSGIDFRKIMEKAVEVRGVFPNYSTDEPDDMRRAIALLERGVLDIRGLVTHRYSLEDSEAGYRACEQQSDGYVKGIIIP